MEVRKAFREQNEPLIFIPKKVKVTKGGMPLEVTEEGFWVGIKDTCVRQTRNRAGSDFSLSQMGAFRELELHYNRVLKDPFLEFGVPEYPTEEQLLRSIETYAPTTHFIQAVQKADKVFQELSNKLTDNSDRVAVRELMARMKVVPTQEQEWVCWKFGDGPSDAVEVHLPSPGSGSSRGLTVLHRALLLRNSILFEDLGMRVVDEVIYEQQAAVAQGLAAAEWTQAQAEAHPPAVWHSDILFETEHERHLRVTMAYIQAWLFFGHLQQHRQLDTRAIQFQSMHLSVVADLTVDGTPQATFFDASSGSLLIQQQELGEGLLPALLELLGHPYSLGLPRGSAASQEGQLAVEAERLGRDVLCRLAESQRPATACLQVLRLALGQKVADPLTLSLRWWFNCSPLVLEERPLTLAQISPGADFGVLTGGPHGMSTRIVPGMAADLGASADRPPPGPGPGAPYMMGPGHARRLRGQVEVLAKQLEGSLGATTGDAQRPAPGTSTTIAGRIAAAQLEALRRSLEAAAGTLEAAAGPAAAAADVENEEEQDAWAKWASGKAHMLEDLLAKLVSPKEETPKWAQAFKKQVDGLRHWRSKPGEARAHWNLASGSEQKSWLKAHMDGLSETMSQAESQLSDHDPHARGVFDKMKGQVQEIRTWAGSDVIGPPPGLEDVIGEVSRPVGFRSTTDRLLQAAKDWEDREARGLPPDAALVASMQKGVDELQRRAHTWGLVNMSTIELIEGAEECAPSPLSSPASSSTAQEELEQWQKAEVARWGEEWVYRWLQKQHAETEECQVVWWNEGEESGRYCDISVRYPDGTEESFEVKSTHSHDKREAQISESQVLCASELKDRFVLVRVFGAGTRTPSMMLLANPSAMWLQKELTGVELLVRTPLPDS